MRGRVPLDAHTLRWYYGLVIDSYPLTIRRADGRIVVEEVQGNAWSRTIDLSNQFHAPLLNQNISIVGGTAVFLPGRGFKDIYEKGRPLFHVFTNVILTF